MKRFFAALLVLSVLASVACAEWSEIIKVVAFDQNNYPVANVPVTIKYQRNNFLFNMFVNGQDTTAKTGDI